MSKTVFVTDEQVESAQTLVRISGGLDKVDPLIAKIAQAKPRRKDEPKS
jgi:hypothetical protein